MAVDRLKTQFSLTRIVNRRERIVEAGCTGHRLVKTGEERVDVELTIDLESLKKKLLWKLRTGSNRTTLADGAIVAKVVRKTPDVLACARFDSSS